jgi:hypothetical protein
MFDLASMSSIGKPLVLADPDATTATPGYRSLAADAAGIQADIERRSPVG